MLGINEKHNHLLAILVWLVIHFVVYLPHRKVSDTFSEIQNELNECEQDEIELLWKYFQKAKQTNDSRTQNNFKKNFLGFVY